VNEDDLRADTEKQNKNNSRTRASPGPHARREVVRTSCRETWYSDMVKNHFLVVRLRATRAIQSAIERAAHLHRWLHVMEAVTREPLNDGRSLGDRQTSSRRMERREASSSQGQRLEGLAGTSVVAVSQSQFAFAISLGVQE
jgi:hypothetical protein